MGRTIRHFICRCTSKKWKVASVYPLIFERKSWSILHYSMSKKSYSFYIVYKFLGRTVSILSRFQTSLWYSRIETRIRPPSYSPFTGISSHMWRNMMYEDDIVNENLFTKKSWKKTCKLFLRDLRQYNGNTFYLEIGM